MNEFFPEADETGRIDATDFTGQYWQNNLESLANWLTTRSTNHRDGALMRSYAEDLLLLRHQLAQAKAQQPLGWFKRGSFEWIEDVLAKGYGANGVEMIGVYEKCPTPDAVPIFTVPQTTGEKSD